MSRDAGGKISALGVAIEGHYRTEFTAPLILESCKHYVEIKKVGIIRKKEWRILHHGRSDGSNSIEWHCRKGE